MDVCRRAYVAGSVADAVGSMSALIPTSIPGSGLDCQSVFLITLAVATISQGTSADKDEVAKRGF
jgi:hypothetical protein